MLELSTGNAPAAWQYLAPLQATTRKMGLNEPTVFAHWADAIEALITQGRLDEARPLLEWLEERGRTLDRPWALATGARCRALFLASQGDFSGAIAYTERALAAHDRLDSPYERARTLLAKGMIQRRAKQKQAARTDLQAALAIFEHLGARRWAERAEHELRRIGGRTRPAGLTETEQRIAELAAEGKNNPEIARAMFLSVKTVEANLSRIYATVGVSSRTELAHLLLTDGNLARKTGPASDQTEGVPGFPRRFRVLRSR
jgi:DNA-binding CsgD family transcriptional regulator